ncbi:hypothetical protein GPL21_38960 [Bradyrhizobium pachyrhizi]|uniref:Uncharacterized protein n=1 Tax=Bradyrhizobium pachyrhizi TaxID=280333 RepID=A0A844SX99_9BRAD|nr:hypothetical protein [Bradyrhizobium pachyrhizi]MVT71027.1 hypothetical protein [Bradyrhizobium pachyrhizi]
MQKEAYEFRGSNTGPTHCGEWQEVRYPMESLRSMELPPSESIDPFSALEPSHRRAIREGIGERLREFLDHDSLPLPARLEALMDQLRRMDDLG